MFFKHAVMLEKSKENEKFLSLLKYFEHSSILTKMIDSVYRIFIKTNEFVSQNILGCTFDLILYDIVQEKKYNESVK